VLLPKEKHKTTYADGLREGFRIASERREKDLETQIKLLRWQVKELSEQLKLRLKLEE